MMSLSWACLGREGTRYLSFQHCLSQRNRGSSGALTQLTSLSPTPPSPRPSSLLATSSFSSVFHILTPALAQCYVPSFPSPAKSSSPAMLLSAFTQSLCLSLCLFGILRPLFPDEIWRVIWTRNGKKSVCCLFLSITPGLVYVLERSERLIKVINGQQEINIHMTNPGTAKAVIINQP